MLIGEALGTLLLCALAFCLGYHYGHRTAIAAALERLARYRLILRALYHETQPHSGEAAKKAGYQAFAILYGDDTGAPLRKD